jgi:hypothetical protein
VPDQTSAAFISYCRDDQEFALRLAQDLKAAGAAVWLDQLDIKPGSSWDNAVEDALLAARQMLVVLTPTSVRSENVRDEISYALKQGKTVIPVLYMECVIPLRLERKQHIDFRADYARGLATLLNQLRVEHPNQEVLDRATEGDAQRQLAWKAREAEAVRRTHAAVASQSVPTPVKPDPGTGRPLFQQLGFRIALAGVLLGVLGVGFVLLHKAGPAAPAQPATMADHTATAAPVAAPQSRPAVAAPASSEKPQPTAERSAQPRIIYPPAPDATRGEERTYAERDHLSSGSNTQSGTSTNPSQSGELLPRPQNAAVARQAIVGTQESSLWRMKGGSYSSYLRFYSDGVVIQVSSTGTPTEIQSWFNEPYEQSGKYSVSGSSIKFSIVSSKGTVDYDGLIRGSSLVLSRFSHINNSSASEIYDKVP